MTDERQPQVTIVDESASEWMPHPRFAGIRMKQLITSAQNPHASVSRVQVPPGSVIGWHNHGTQVETIYVISGAGVLTLGERESRFAAGEIVAVPAAIQHTLRNEGSEVVELLCLFTPPTV